MFFSDGNVENSLSDVDPGDLFVGFALDVPSPAAKVVGLVGMGIFVNGALQGGLMDFGVAARGVGFLEPGGLAEFADIKGFHLNDIIVNFNMDI